MQTGLSIVQVDSGKIGEIRWHIFYNHGEGCWLFGDDLLVELDVEECTRRIPKYIIHGPI